MSISLKWFKEQIKNVTKSIIENRVEKAVQELENEELTKKEHPAFAIRLVNNVLTVVLKDGNILTKEGADVDDYKKALDSISEDELFEICCSEEVAEEKKKYEEEVKRAEAIINGIELLEELDDFIVEGNVVYLKGIDRSLPQILVEKFIEIVSDYTDYDGDSWEAGEPIIDIYAIEEDEEYIGLKRFFMWCCLNPRAEVADTLYGFLDKNGMKITKQGFFVALRNVVKVEGADTELIHFITNAYNKVKAVWKKKPINYGVYKGSDGDLDFGIIETAKTSPDYIGNLQDLYLNLPEMEENRYTDNWTKTFDIRIGKVVNMPIEECNWSTQDCATAGLK